MLTEMRNYMSLIDEYSFEDKDRYHLRNEDFKKAYFGNNDKPFYDMSPEIKQFLKSYIDKLKAEIDSGTFVLTNPVHWNPDECNEELLLPMDELIQRYPKSLQDFYSITKCNYSILIGLQDIMIELYKDSMGRFLLEDTCPYVDTSITAPYDIVTSHYYEVMAYIDDNYYDYIYPCDEDGYPLEYIDKKYFCLSATEGFGILVRKAIYSLSINELTEKARKESDYCIKVRL